MRSDSDAQELLALLQTKSVARGDFVLASGARSSYYIDCRLTTLDPRGAWLVGKVMLRVIQAEAQRLSAKVDAVGGLTMGADPIALATAMQSHAANPASALRCFVVRKEPKGHGKGRQVEGNFKEDDRVVVIDDVITTGESTIKAIKAIQSHGGHVVFAAVLVDRQQGGRANIEAMGIPVVAAFTRDDLLGTVGEQDAR